jgi:hypothetical protein
MDKFLKYRLPYRECDLQVGTDSLVLTQAFVEESLRRDERRDDSLSAFRGAVNGILISLVFWITLGLILFKVL